MTSKRQFDDQISVSGQIDPADVAELARNGVTMIINNRPDGEDDGQPLGAEIEAAAERAGIAYRHVPIARGMGPSDIECMHQAIEAADDGQVFAFCRSGNRSSLVSALARRKQGRSVDEVVKCVRNAGADPAPIAHLL
ncbi:MAG: TIGR01244 family sulfur transferase [Sphingomicrobium sp.]